MHFRRVFCDDQVNFDAENTIRGRVENQLYFPGCGVCCAGPTRPLCVVDREAPDDSPQIRKQNVGVIERFLYSADPLTSIPEPSEQTVISPATQARRRRTGCFAIGRCAAGLF